MLLVGENSPPTVLLPFCFSFLGDRCVETGVPGLLRFMERGGPGESTAVGLGPGGCRTLLSAGLLMPRGEAEGSDMPDVVLLGEPGVGLGTATGTLADLVAWWYGGGGP